MAREGIFDEARLVSFTDEQLIDYIGTLWESAKRIDEAMKSDPEIERMQIELKNYKDENYLDNRRDIVRKLKASRALAKVRGVQFTLPQREESEE